MRNMRKKRLKYSPNTKKAPKTRKARRQIRPSPCLAFRCPPLFLFVCLGSCSNEFLGGMVECSRHALARASLCFSSFLALTTQVGINNPHPPARTQLLTTGAWKTTRPDAAVPHRPPPLPKEAGSKQLWFTASQPSLAWREPEHPCAAARPDLTPLPPPPPPPSPGG